MNFVEFEAHMPEDAVRGLGGALEQPNGRALANAIRVGMGEAGVPTLEPQPHGATWLIEVPVRGGTIQCTLQWRDHWYLSTGAHQVSRIPWLSARRLNADHSCINELLDQVLRADARIGDIRWYSQKEYEARVQPIPAARFEELLARGVSPELARFITIDRHRFREVSYWCADPNEAWPYYLAPHIKDARQLWSTNADPTVIASVDGRTTFLKIHHEDIDRVTIGHSERELAAALLTTVMETEDWDDEGDMRARMRRLAEAMGYRDFEDLYTRFISMTG